MRALATSSQEERDLMQEQHEQVLASERIAHQTELNQLKAAEAAERDRKLAEELGNLKTTHEEEMSRLRASEKQKRRAAISEVEDKLKSEREAHGLALQALTAISASKGGEEQAQALETQKKEHQA